MLYAPSISLRQVTYSVWALEYIVQRKHLSTAFPIRSNLTHPLVGPRCEEGFYTRDGRWDGETIEERICHSSSQPEDQNFEIAQEAWSDLCAKRKVASNFAICT